MSNNNNNNNNNEKNPDASSTGTWQLPDGIENVIESGIIKASVGAATGALLGTILFRSGKGWRSAGVAVGVGVAVGSTVERAWNNKSFASKN